MLSVQHARWVLSTTVSARMAAATTAHGSWNSFVRPHRPRDTSRGAPPTLIYLLGAGPFAALMGDDVARRSFFSFSLPAAHELLCASDLHHMTQQCRNLATRPWLRSCTYDSLGNMMRLCLRLLGVTGILPHNYSTITIYDQLVLSRLTALRQHLFAQPLHDPRRKAYASILDTAVDLHGVILQLLQGTTVHPGRGDLRSSLLYTRWCLSFALSHHTSHKWLQQYLPVMPHPDMPRPANTFDSRIPSGFLYIICGTASAYRYVG